MDMLPDLVDFLGDFKISADKRLTCAQGFKKESAE